MIDYDGIINQLTEEADSCGHRYISGTSTLVPVYYQQEIRTAVAQLIKCRDSLKGLQHPPTGAPHDPYKTDQLLKMLDYETREGEVHYGARLHHDDSGAKVLTIDAGGLRALISHYATHYTDLGNEEDLQPGAEEGNV